MGAKPQPCYIRIRIINNRVIMRLQCRPKLRTQEFIRMEVFTN